MTWSGLSKDLCRSFILRLVSLHEWRPQITHTHNLHVSKSWPSGIMLINNMLHFSHYPLVELLWTVCSAHPRLVTVTAWGMVSPVVPVLSWYWTQFYFFVSVFFPSSIQSLSSFSLGPVRSSKQLWIVYYHLGSSNILIKFSSIIYLLAFTLFMKVI
jgi:hypothetical protein